MQTEFTPLMSLGGGVLIGLSAVLLIPSSFSDWSWRAAVIAGMVSAPLLIWLISGGFPVIEVPVSTPMLLIGGFIVGIGVTVGSGCTSGHGVCGMARLSPRSLVATGVFMATTIITVFVIRHVLGL